MNFSVLHKDAGSGARTGKLVTDHGEIDTPIFMPVGTLGTVKGLFHRDLVEDVKAQIILGNTYHLYLRPGLDVIEKAGGFHKFCSWDRPVLTDSGGYQIFSLAAKRKLTPEGYFFQSHIDGSRHFFSPEKAVDIQRLIGADIIMALDECTPGDAPYDYAAQSLTMTQQWLERGLARFRSTDGLYGYSQSFFPVVQGCVYPELRKQAALYAASLDAQGYAIGGLSVGEPTEVMYQMIETVDPYLPLNKPRYLMGVGTPANILEGIARGIDMFDCVMPTRNGRNGMLFTGKGMINIKNRKWADDLSAIDPEGTSFVDKINSRAYLRHLFIAGEMLGPQIASLHNLAFYLQLVREAALHIKAGDFTPWKNKMVGQLETRL
ncbi:MAG TPA: tRNA guanosine(34) transglycosylase Tgt [Rikenellaceae bacterium]|nr:tRNA guanosine(34) transglycosylase Tgt [Rikenellaceae bacterium]